MEIAFCNSFQSSGAASIVTKPQIAPWVLKIFVRVDSNFTKQGIEKLTTPIDSKWPHYPEINNPLNLENYYFFKNFPNA
jgi:hypothetical protein